jgi:four helix bundle protein
LAVGGWQLAERRAMPVQNYRELIAWQKAMDLVEKVYRLTNDFPREELYGLTNQLRRAVVSIPSNIAEGQGRGGPNEFMRFLHIAHGSLREVETQVLIAMHLKYGNATTAQDVLDAASEAGRIINGLLKSLMA